MRTWILLWVFVCGCSADPLFLQWPGSSSGAAVVAVSTSEELSVMGMASTSSTPLRIQLYAPPEVTTTFELLTYSRSLSDLGLPSGEIQQGGSEELPGADLTYSTRVTEGVAEPWRVVEQRSEKLASFRFEGDQEKPCPITSSFELLPNSQGGWGFLTHTSSGTVIAGTASGTAYRVTHDGLQPITVSPAVRMLGIAALDNTGTLWIMTEDTLNRASLSADETTLHLEPVATSSAGSIFRWLEVRQEAGLVEAVGLTARGLLERYDGQQWRVVDQIGDGQVGTIMGGMVMLASREILAVHHEVPLVHRYLPDGTVHHERIPLQVLLLEQFADLADIPGYGPLVATNQGRIFHHDGSNWVELVDLGSEYDFFGMTAFEDGFILTTWFKETLYYHSATQSCEVHLPGFFSKRKWIERLGDHLILTSRNVDTVAVVELQ